MATILVVDDNQELRELFSLLLKMNGYEVGIANDREHALELIDTLKPDLILLDVLLQKENGRDICKEIKQKQKNIPVILISANPKLLMDIDTCEANEVLEKPFDINMVKDKIQKTLNNARESRYETAETTFEMKDSETYSELEELRTIVLQKFNAFQNLVKAHFEKEGSAIDKFELVAGPLQNNSPEGKEYVIALENLNKYKKAKNIK